MTRTFAITWDYRCPYARIAHDHVIAGLRGGADWDVSFLAFSLSQSHVEEGTPDVWDAPEIDSGLPALSAAIAVRDNWPERFIDVHEALFEFRHGRNGNLRDRDAVGEVLTEHGLDAGEVWTEVDSGRPLDAIREDHTRYAKSHSVWGVPTFVQGDAAVFVRLLDRPSGTADAIATVERVLDQVDWPVLNEFKHTSVPR